MKITFLREENKNNIYLFLWKYVKKLWKILLSYELSVETVIKNNEKGDIWVSIQITILFFYPTSDEKNYANPCICPELWLYYINLS